MNLTYRLALCGMTLLLSQHSAIAIELHCPATIDAEQTVIKAPPAWVANNVQRAHALSGAGFTDGPPKELGFLRPDTEYKDKFEINTYHVGGTDLYRNWLNCIYEGTSATVAQAIPAELKECSVTYEIGKKNRAQLKSIHCK